MMSYRSEIPRIDVQLYRERLAIHCVKLASSYIDASYSAYCRREQGKVGLRYEAFWSALAGRACRVLIPLAIKLDKESATTEMIEQSWWG